MKDTSGNLNSAGKFARVMNGVDHFAQVELFVTPSEQERYITFVPFLFGEREEEYPSPTHDSWKKGALSGITFAMRQCNISFYLVTVTKIVGTYVDTNPIIVGAAAIDAIWKLYHFDDTEERKRVEKIVRSSWKHAEEIPDFSLDNDS